MFTPKSVLAYYLRKNIFEKKNLMSVFGINEHEEKKVLEYQNDYDKLESYCDVLLFKYYDLKNKIDKIIIKETK